jgi:hypothetical protein
MGIEPFDQFCEGSTKQGKSRRVDDPAAALSLDCQL